VNTELVVHGHFYQPPRENPWTEEVSREPSAGPFHDWNERIAAESYRPNGFARIVDDHDRVVAIVNNYERLSFDIGPTLMSWLEDHAVEAYERIVAADGAGGGAIAQAFFHTILPLAAERDVRTQVRWGLADFCHRFGRDAEGMWLPETAVNDAVLAVLAEEGVRFTILAPDQAVRVRALDSEEWDDVTGGSIDVSRPYRWLHPAGDGRGVDIVFYDGPLSHLVAFEPVASQALVDRAAAASGMVCIATDGETFGHHQKYADRGLAYALAVEAPRRGLPVTTAAAALRDNPPGHEVAVRESAWSCAHGVGRWKEDCGCTTRSHPGWNQRWRAPLRAALDLLRDWLEDVFERRGAEVLKDPWSARDAYVNVVLGTRSRDEFAAEHVTGDPVDAFTLLECQRHALAMFTSCGWFFADLAALDTVQVLRYAARAMDLARELGEDPPEAEFLDVLTEARSNEPVAGDGRRVWHRQVVPARVTAQRVVAHLALVELLERGAAPGPLGGFDVEHAEHYDGDRGATAFCAGRVVVVHRRTGRRAEHVYAALHLGGLEVLGAMRPADRARDAGAFTLVRETFESGSPVSGLVRLVSEAFGPTEFDLGWALPDAAEQILEGAAGALTERFAESFEHLYEDNRDMIMTLAAAGYALPRALRAPAEIALARRFEGEVAAQEGSWDPVAYRSAVEVVRLAHDNRLSIDTPGALETMQRIILDAVERAVAEPDDEAVDRALALIDLARELQLYPDVDVAQELVYEALLAGGAPPLRRLGDALGLAVDHLGRPT